MPIRTDYIRPLDFKHGRIDMSHGAGGRASAQLIGELFLKAFDNEWLRQGNDQAVFDAPPELMHGGRLVMSTDGHVVSPLQFPGGDVGCLCVHGTINDVAMAGARPLYLSAGFIIEEGFAIEDLKKILTSMRAAAAEAGVEIVTGDTKVVQKGGADKIFINTSGVGVIETGVRISASNAQPGDKVIVSGNIGDHGTTVMIARGELDLETDIESDTAALNSLVAAMIDEAGNDVDQIRVLRDPTRGGVATTLNGTLVTGAFCAVHLPVTPKTRCIVPPWPEVRFEAILIAYGTPQYGGVSVGLLACWVLPPWPLVSTLHAGPVSDAGTWARLYDVNSRVPLFHASKWP